MGDRTSIEWTATIQPDGSVTPGSSWTPIRARNRETGLVGWFCIHASDGCTNCYAEAINRRLGSGVDYRAQDRDKVEVYLGEKILAQPLRWKKPRKIFVCSMTDLFGEWVTDEMIDKIFAVMALCPQHTFIVLTKRSARMRKYFQEAHITAPDGLGWRWCMAVSALLGGERSGRIPFPLPNVWLLVSVEDQRRADERIPDLLGTPAAVRGVSYEPAIEGIDIQRYLRRMVVRPNEELTDRMVEEGWSFEGGDGDHPGLNWTICGGESGAGARPFNIEWARSVIAQCKAAAVPVFMKQVGAKPFIGRNGGTMHLLYNDRKGGDISEWPEDLRVREYPERGDG